MSYFKVVKLNKSLSYNTTVSFKNVRLKLSFTWNERLGARVVSVSDVSGDVLVRSKLLFPETEIKFSSNAKLKGYDASITLFRIPDGYGDIKDWSNKYVLIISEV